jgi:fructan beta-fructosidase
LAQRHDLLLASQPIAGLDKLLENSVTLNNVAVKGSYDLGKSLRNPTGRYRLKFTVPQAQPWAIVLSNTAKEQVIIGYDATKKAYYFDRSKSGNVTFAPADKGFTKVARAPRAAASPTQEITLLVDAASAELFADGGTTCLTGTFFPSQPLTGLALQADGSFILPRVELAGVASIWNK